MGCKSSSHFFFQKNICTHDCVCTRRFIKSVTNVFVNPICAVHKPRCAVHKPCLCTSLCTCTSYSQTSIVRNASDFQLLFELSEFRTYRVGFFRIVGNIRACQMTACLGRMCEITSYEVFTCSTKSERMKTIIVTKII